MKQKILISTGGSGGHVKPAIALYEHLNERFDVIFSTDIRGKKFFETPINYNGRSYGEGKKIKPKDFFIIIFQILLRRLF